MDREYQDMLIFEVAGQRHGLAVADVQELLPALSILPMHDAPVHIEGVINLRGAIVSVLDVRSRLGLPAKALLPTDHFIIVRSGDGLFALHVDRALELARVEAAELKTADQNGGRRAVAKWKDALVLLHPVGDLVTVPMRAAPQEATPS